MFRLAKSRYIPTNAVPQYFNDVNAVVYLDEYNGCPRAIGYSGKRNNWDFNYYFQNHEKRALYIANWIKRLQEHKNILTQRHLQRKAFKHTLKVGDILHTHWGYDQANVEFFEVIEIKNEKSVVIREVASTKVEDTSWCSSKVTLKNKTYIGEPMVKRVSEQNIIKLDKVRWAFPWDGKPRHCSRDC